MTTTQEAIRKVKEQAPALQEVRAISRINVGQAIRQGDLYLIAINPKGKTTFKTSDDNEITINADHYVCEGPRQLAPGKSTGSKHCINDKHVVIRKNHKETNVILGDIVHADSSFTLSHPEHAHFNLPAGSYIVAYQLDFSTKQRVQD